MLYFVEIFWFMRDLYVWKGKLWIFEDCDNALGLFRKLKRLGIIEIQSNRIIMEQVISIDLELYKFGEASAIKAC